MKYTPTFILLTFFCAATATATAIEFTAPPELRDGRWLKKVAVTVDKGTVRCDAVTEQPGVNYVSFRLPVKHFLLTGKAISFGVRSDAPQETTGFYVRALDENNKIIASFQAWGILKKDRRNILLVPGVSGTMTWEKTMLQSSPSAPVHKLLIYLAARGLNSRIQAEISDLSIVDAPSAAKSAARFEELGTGAKSAELRSLIAAHDANGKRLVITRPQDHGGRGYLLLTDVDSGRSTQYFVPDTVAQGDTFGSVLSRAGKYYFDYPSGKVLEFDINTRKFRLLGVPDPKARHFMVYIEGNDGKIWLGSYPNAGLCVFDPATGKFRNYGRMDAKESYLDSIAIDSTGTVYCGIGSARANIVALDPASGRVTPILPEEMRGTGYGKVFTAEDGSVHAAFGKFRVRLSGGKIVEINPPKTFPKGNKSAKYSELKRFFGDGSQVLHCDLYRREMTIRERNGEVRTLPFSFLSGGLEITSLAADAAGNIYGSTCHPMHFIAINGKDGKITDHGPNPVVAGGNFCNLTAAANGKMYAGEYAGGRLWEFDPAQTVCQSAAARYGLAPRELAALGTSDDGKFIPLGAPPVLFCGGDGETARFRFRFPTAATGKLYLNLLPFGNAAYGKVKFSVGTQNSTVDLRRPSDGITAPVVFGPVTPVKGAVELFCDVQSHPGGKAWFALAGAAIDAVPLREIPPAMALNPRIVGRWRDEVTRPRAVLAHPDNEHIIMSGFANYGLNGGGLGIHHIPTGRNSIVPRPLPGQSCIAMCALPGGDIIGGTSYEAPGGGVQTAVNAVIFRFDWKNRKIALTLPLPGVKEVVSLTMWHNHIVAALSNGELIAVKPDTLEILFRHDIAAWGKVPRNALQKSADNRLFLLQGQGISEITPGTFAPEYLAMPAASISTGGAIVGHWLYFACWTKMVRFRLPDSK